MNDSLKKWLLGLAAERIGERSVERRARGMQPTSQYPPFTQCSRLEEDDVTILVVRQPHSKRQKRQMQHFSSLCSPDVLGNSTAGVHLPNRLSNYQMNMNRLTELCCRRRAAQ